MAEYDLYCHYVAGLVGEGLSRIFSVEIEGENVLEAATTLANSMGLVLQKTNIIRDFLEDYVDGRTFWPKEVKCFCLGVVKNNSSRCLMIPWCNLICLYPRIRFGANIQRQVAWESSFFPSTVLVECIASMRW